MIERAGGRAAPWRGERHGHFKASVERDDDIRRFLKPSEIAEVFKVERYLTHVDEIFKRVFGK